MHEPTPKLKHPAIVEAVCELRFSASQPYSIVAGAMRERLKSKFPHLEVLSTAALLGGLPEEFLAVPMPCHRFKTDRPNAMGLTRAPIFRTSCRDQNPRQHPYRDRPYGLAATIERLCGLYILTTMLRRTTMRDACLLLLCVKIIALFSNSTKHIQTNSLIVSNPAPSTNSRLMSLPQRRGYTHSTEEAN